MAYLTHSEETGGDAPAPQDATEQRKTRISFELHPSLLLEDLISEVDASATGINDEDFILNALGFAGRAMEWSVLLGACVHWLDILSMRMAYLTYSEETLGDILTQQDATAQ